MTPTGLLDWGCWSTPASNGAGKCFMKAPSCMTRDKHRNSSLNFFREIRLSLGCLRPSGQRGGNLRPRGGSWKLSSYGDGVGGGESAPGRLIFFLSSSFFTSVIFLVSLSHFYLIFLVSLSRFHLSVLWHLAAFTLSCFFSSVPVMFSEYSSFSFFSLLAS